MNEQRFFILWPEQRYVTAAQIETWYSDAIANEEVDDLTCETPADKAAELHHAGVITLGRDLRPYRAPGCSCTDRQLEQVGCDCDASREG